MSELSDEQRLARIREAVEDIEVLSRRTVLLLALAEYAGHASWRCKYRSRYGRCLCGLDELTTMLGLPRVEVDDPEAKR